MGAKGKKRREKNYRAAHGGYTGLPPPPDPRKLDALPFKLRQIMSFTKPQQHQHGDDDGLSKEIDKKQKKDDVHAPKNEDTAGQLKEHQYTDSVDEQLLQSSANDKKKKKRKRKEVKDLRFAMEMDTTRSKLKKRERKKKYLESKKKKHKKAHEDENIDFPEQEKIKFGDVVQAPPKLAVVPRAFKSAHDASQERLRLRAIEEYRNRKKWTSRPGSHLPPPLTSES